MRNNNQAWTLVMGASMAAVVLLTTIMCTAQISSGVNQILMVLDAAAAVMFTICPAMFGGNKETA